MDYEYKLVCTHSTEGLTKKVNDMVKDGWRPMGPHTHQKSHHVDVVESTVWYNVFCISMEKKIKDHVPASP